MPENIVLIGFMGVGKGQVARALAALTSMYAVDCDDLIESSVNMKVKKIFSQEGEERFRQLERQTAIWLEKNVKNSIISTGGGFVNVPNLNKIGTVIYLHADFDTIIKKIQSHPNSQKKIKKRPLLQDINKAEKLYKKRLSTYREAADIIVNVDTMSSKAVSLKLIKLCRLPKTKN